VLEIRGLVARYGPVTAVRGIDLDVGRGEIVAVVGANGAGKSTALRSIIGQHRDRSGQISIDGQRVSLRGGAVTAARAGIAIVPQGRRLFASLTVSEHLDLAASRRQARKMTIDDALELFPNLARRLGVRAGLLSGGEQQMLAIARAALLGPSFILMDEPTEGLAPTIVDSVVALVEQLPERGMGVVVTDQQPGGALVALAGARYEMVRGELRPAEVPFEARVEAVS
jgi:branched-chain amino acid transport system ATP-binding protein